MSGANMFLGRSARACRERTVEAPMTADTLQNANKSILASLSARHRITKGGIRFNKLLLCEIKQFYQEAIDHILNCSTGNLTAMESASRVAMTYNIIIEVCDRGRIKTTVNNRLKAAKALHHITDAINA